ncbi:MAG: hypothetical protein R3F60_13190 [bacterium]
MRRALFALALVACDPAPSGAPPVDPDAGALPPRPARQTCVPAPLDPARVPAVVGRHVLGDLSLAGVDQAVEAPRGDAWLLRTGETIARAPVGPGAGRPEALGRIPGLIDFAPRADGAVLALVAEAAGVAVLRVPVADGRLELRDAERLAEAPGITAGDVAAGREATWVALAGGDILRVDAAGTVEPWASGLVRPQHCTVDDEEEALWCLDGEVLHRLAAGERAGEATQVPVGAGCALIGAVYRGAQWPERFGWYFGVERCTDEVRGRGPDGRVERLGRLDAPAVEAARDHLDRALVRTAAGRLLALDVADPDTHLGWPDRLSATGCFASLDPLVAGPDLVPYDLNAPLWSDGADKARWLVLPPGEAATAPPDGAWDFPENSILIKHFAFTDGQGRARPVETRVMVRRSFGWSFHTWRWDADGQEAWLLDGLEAEYADLDAGGAPLRYLYPSRADCHACHSRRGEQVLGPRAAQLDRPSRYGPPQLDLLAEAGLLDRRPVATPMADPDDDAAPLEARARAWLHANCAHCHQPGGYAPPDLGLDLRVTTPLAQTGTCDVEPLYPAFGIEGSRRIRPGRPDDSHLYLRLVASGFGRMPLLGTERDDPRITSVVGPWIASLTGCPEAR